MPATAKTTLVGMLAVLLYWQGGVFCSALETTLLRDLRVRIHGQKSHSGRLREVLIAGESAIDRLLADLVSPTEQEWVAIVVFDEGSPPPVLPPLGREILLPANASVQTVVEMCARLLIARRLPPARREVNLEWLAAAVAYNVLYARTASGLYQPDYSALIASFRQGPPLSPVGLVKHPVPPSWPYAFRFYAMQCHALCEVLAAAMITERSALAHFANGLGEGADIGERWRETLEMLATDSDDAELWLRRRIERLAQRGLAGGGGEDVGERIREVFGVAVLAPGPDGAMGYRKIPIRELREHFPQARLESSVLAAKEHQVFELLKQAPLILQRPLANYMAALQARRSGHRWKTFTDMLEQADIELQDALRRYEGARRLLDDLARQYGRAAFDLAPFLEIAAEHARAADALAPYTNPSIFAPPQK